MLQLTIETNGVRNIGRKLQKMGNPAILARISGNALSASALQLRNVAKTRDFVFMDRRGARQGGRRGRNTQTGKYPSLRSSIRVARIPGYYGGRKYKRGRAGVYAGGSGSRQAHLVEAGHGGPWKAKPYPFIKKAALQSRTQMSTAFGASVRRQWPREIRRLKTTAADRRRTSVLLGGSLGARTARGVFRTRQSFRR